MTEFKGNQQDRDRLIRAIKNNCGCSYDGDGQLSQVCGAHKLLTGSQRELDGLLYGRNIRGKFLVEEMTYGKKKR